MSIELNWFHRGQVIFCKLEGQLTPADIAEADRLMRELLDQGTRPQIHAIVDCCELQLLPTSLLDWMRITWPRHELMGWTVTYGLDNPIYRVVAQTVRNWLAFRYHAVTSQEEALRFLREVDPMLNGGSIELLDEPAP